MGIFRIFNYPNKANISISADLNKKRKSKYKKAFQNINVLQKLFKYKYCNYDLYKAILENIYPIKFLELWMVNIRN